LAWSDLFVGIAFYLIIEGLFPFAAPDAWRKGLASIAQLQDHQLRTFGLAVVIAGLVLLFIARS
jgi:uncharacterized protein YjeT (DUF2065 family)